jgi:hypothetical protein
MHIEVSNASAAQKIFERHHVRSAYSIDILRCFLGNARAMMSTVYAVARAYCLSTEWTGTPPARWFGEAGDKRLESFSRLLPHCVLVGQSVVTVSTSCVANFSNIFSSRTPWRKAVMMEAYEI